MEITLRKNDNIYNDSLRRRFMLSLKRKFVGKWVTM